MSEKALEAYKRTVKDDILRLVKQVMLIESKYGLRLDVVIYPPEQVYGEPTGQE